jgi:hypothetical protein
MEEHGCKEGEPSKPRPKPGFARKGNEPRPSRTR